MRKLSTNNAASSARRRLAATIAGATCALGGVALVPASASAAHVTFCTNVLLQAGGSQSSSNTCTTGGVYGVFVRYVNADALSNAAVCAQLYATSRLDSGIDSKCGGVGDRVTSGPYNEQGQFNPGIHNHSTHQGRFSGSYDNSQ